MLARVLVRFPASLARSFRTAPCSMAPSTMKAILVKDGVSKTPDGLYLGEAPTPVPQTGEVLVKIHAFGINRMDSMQRMGQYPLPPGVSTILGVEFSGTIEDPNGSSYAAGDEVFGLAYGGAYAQYIACSDKMVVRKPAEVSHVKAAAIPENWITAWQALYTIAGLQPGKSVMIHAGASGVGLAAIQLAKTFTKGLIIATAGTDDKVKFIQQHGATHGINYKTQDFAAEVNRITNGEGVSVVIDFVGQSYWEKNIASLAKEGHMVLLGLMSGAKTEQPLNLLPILFKRLRIEGTTLRSRSLEYQSDLLQTFSREAMPKVFAHAGGGAGLDIVIHKTYDWSDIVQAHSDMEAARNIGKLICLIPQ